MEAGWTNTNAAPRYREVAVRVSRCMNLADCMGAVRVSQAMARSRPPTALAIWHK